MTRQPHWQRLLRDAVRAHHRPFAWGTNDCCSFVCDCVQAMTGTDIYADFRGKYDSAASALTAMTVVCGSALVEVVAGLITEKFSMPPVDPYYAQPGDVVLLPAGALGELVLGIVSHDNMHAFVVSHAGLNRLKYVRIAKKAWKV